MPCPSGFLPHGLVTGRVLTCGLGTCVSEVFYSLFCGFSVNVHWSYYCCGWASCAESPEKSEIPAECDSRIAPPGSVLTPTREELGEGWGGREAPLPPSKRVSFWIATLSGSVASEEPQ